MSRMSPAAYRQLLTLLRHVVSDNPPDDQVRRLSKGLAKALATWLRIKEPQHAQARNGAPRVDGRLAVVNASLSSNAGDSDGTHSRTEGADLDRGE